MDVESIIKAIDELSPEDQERIKTHLRERERELNHPHTVEEWLTVIDEAVADFRGNSSPEEIEQIAAAMSAKFIDPRAWNDEP